MSDNFDPDLSDFAPLFEIGIANNNPAVKGYGGSLDKISPIQLAAMTTVLFETVMMHIQESQQNEFEKQFNKAFKKLMKERHNFEVKRTIIDQIDDE
jgi:hypothetical protein